MAVSTASALLVIMECIACAGSLAPSGADRAVAAGVWGGEHAALTVTDAGAHIEFDCASGDIHQPLTLDADSRIDVRGDFVPEHPGPVRIGEEPDRKPARYAGHVAGDTMTLEVTIVESNETAGTFTLTLGAQPRVRKCR